MNVVRDYTFVDNDGNSLTFKQTDEGVECFTGTWAVNVYANAIIGIENHDKHKLVNWLLRGDPNINQPPSREEIIGRETMQAYADFKNQQIEILEFLERIAKKVIDTIP